MGEIVEVFGIRGSPYTWRVQLALEWKGLPYEVRWLERSAGEHRAPDYLALNPRGRVPTARRGGVVVRESLAILAWLEALAPDPPLFGGDATATARVWQAVMEYQSYVDPRVEALILPLYFGRVAEEEVAVREAAAALADELDRAEAILGRTDWMAGDAPSAADVVWLPGVRSIARAAAKPAAEPLALGLLPLAARWPRLDAWADRMATTPGFARTWPPNWR